MPVTDLELSFQLSLGHLRLQEFASRGEAVRRRMEAGAPAVVSPRYTPRDYPACLDCRRVDDLYALDPWRSLPMLGVLVRAAVLSAGATS